MIFFLVGLLLLVDYLLITLHGVDVLEYETLLKNTVLNSNSKITALYSCNRSAVLTYMYIHTHTSSCLLESYEKWQTYIHPYPRLIACTIHTQSHPYIQLIARTTHTCILGRRVEWKLHIHIHSPVLIPTLDCLHKHTCTSWRVHILHYRSVSFTRVQDYTQSVYLFHQCGTSLFSRDGLIAYRTVRHPDVDRPFSSYFICNISLCIYAHLITQLMVF